MSNGNRSAKIPENIASAANDGNMGQYSTWSSSVPHTKIVYPVDAAQCLLSQEENLDRSTDE